QRARDEIRTDETARHVAGVAGRHACLRDRASVVDPAAARLGIARYGLSRIRRRPGAAARHLISAWISPRRRTGAGRTRGPRPVRGRPRVAPAATTGSIRSAG